MPLRPLPIKMKFDSPFTPLFTPPEDECVQLRVIEAPGLTTRERLGITACQSLVQPREDGSITKESLQERVQAFLLHLAVLKHCTLLERQHWVGPQRCRPREDDCEFLRQVVELSLILLEKDTSMVSADIPGSDWDLYDAMDGSLFHFMLDTLRTGRWLPSQIIQSWQHLWSVFCAGTDVRFSEHLPQLITKSTDQELSRNVDKVQVSALPFSHPVLDGFLKDIKLKESRKTQDASLNSVFEDLHHWHNTKLLLPTRKIEKLGFFARKNKQKRLASIVAYSASLTNARGKLIDPEIVVVKTTGNSKKKRAPTENANVQPQSKSKKPGRPGNKVGGRESALRAAQELQEQKALVKRNSTVALWTTTCQEIEKEHSLLTRYLKALRFLNDRSKADNIALGSEVHLYLCHLLGQLWAKAQADEHVAPGTGKSQQRHTHANKRSISLINLGMYRILSDCSYLEMASRTSCHPSLQGGGPDNTESNHLPRDARSFGHSRRPDTQDGFSIRLQVTQEYEKKHAQLSRNATRVCGPLYGPTVRLSA